MIRATWLTILFSLCVSGPEFARAADPVTAGAGHVPVEERASDALDVISSRHAMPHDKYLILMCTSDREESLEKDSDIGVFVRYKRIAGSDLAVVVMPARANDGSTYVVYFKGGKPLGLVAAASSQDKPNDETVAKSYVLLTDAVQKQERRPVFETGTIQADDGTEILTLKIVGWK
jgi:hypothetical protein